MQLDIHIRYLNKFNQRVKYMIRNEGVNEIIVEILIE